VKQILLTKNEEKVLYGLVKYPGLNDSELSSIIDVKFSTFTSIKRRLFDQGFFRKLTVPMLNYLGCELLAVIYTQFNPVIPLNERIKTTKKQLKFLRKSFFQRENRKKVFRLAFQKTILILEK